MTDQQQESLRDDADREADRLLYLYLNGGDPGPDGIHRRIAALLRNERALTTARQVPEGMVRLWTGQEIKYIDLDQGSLMAAKREAAQAAQRSNTP
jgi:hypothetical protein